MVSLRFFLLIFWVCLVRVVCGQEPRIFETGKLEAFDIINDKRFGNAIDVYNDIVVIADKDNNKVYIFQKSGEIWDKKQELRPFDEKNNNFGNNVSIYSDYLLVSAPEDSDNGINSGAVYIFKNNGESWIYEKKILGETDNCHFGYSLGIHNNLIVISDLCSNVSIFELIEDGCTKLQTLNRMDYGFFGAKVDISENFILVGAPSYDEYGSSSGAIFTYIRSDNIWIEQDTITASNASSHERFGEDISLSGNRFITISHFNHQAYIFDWNGNNWNETILTLDYNNIRWLSNLSLRDEYAAVASNTNIYIFKLEDLNWVEIAKTVSFPSDGVSAIELLENEVISTPGSTSGKVFVYQDFYEENQDLNIDQTLISSGSKEKDYLARAVSIDNNFLAIGAASSNNTRGTVYTYKRKPDNTWEQMSQITKENGEQLDQFGRAVSMSGDYLAVSSMGYEDGEYAGLIDIYRRSGDNWIHTATIDPLDYGGIDWDYFGFSLAMENDYLVVGAPTPLVHPDSHHDDHHFGDKQGQSPGATYVFKRNGFVWNLIDKFQEPTGEIGDNFGYSTAISGNKIVVGAPRKNDASGVAFVYEIEEQEDTTTISYRQPIYAPDSIAGDKFALSVDIKDDHIIVGAPQDENPATTRGKAYIFQAENDNWNYKKTLEPSNGVKNDRFGWSVAIDRGVSVVGANLSNLKGSNSGAAYVFQGEGANWVEKDTVTASDGQPEEQFGIAVAIDRNINTDIVIGASHAGDTKGAAYAYYMECVCTDNGIVDEAAPVVTFNPSRTWNPATNLDFVLSNDTLTVNAECFDISEAFAITDVIVEDICSYTIDLAIKEYHAPDFSSTQFEDFYLDRDARIIWTVTDLCGNISTKELVVDVQSSRCVKGDCSTFAAYDTLVGAATRECQNASSKIRFVRKTRNRLAKENQDDSNYNSNFLMNPLCIFDGQIVCDNNNEILHKVTVHIITCEDLSDPIFDYCEMVTQEGNCGEIFIDSGGGDGNYADDEIIDYIFCPNDPNTQVITVTFSSFAVEANPFIIGECYDFLEVFNGDDNTTSLGQFCGMELSNAPGGGRIHADNPTGCLMFRFDSDSDSQQAGWVANVSCVNFGGTDNCTEEEITVNIADENTPIYHARQHLYSNSIIENSQEVIFKAGVSITLQSNFYAKAGASFTAKIEACSDNLSYPSNTIKKQTYPSTHLFAYPNPFTNQTTISYNLATDDVLSIQIVDITGQQVAVLKKREVHTKGKYNLSFINNQLKKGTYFVVLKGAVYTETIKLLLIH